MRVLITAASRHHATTDVAQAIADTLERAGIEVAVHRPEEVGHLASYDAVIPAPRSTPAIGSRRRRIS